MTSFGGGGQKPPRREHFDQSSNSGRERPHQLLHQFPFSLSNSNIQSLPVIIRTKDYLLDNPFNPSFRNTPTDRLSQIACAQTIDIRPNRILLEEGHPSTNTSGSNPQLSQMSTTISPKRHPPSPPPTPNRANSAKSTRPPTQPPSHPRAPSHPPKSAKHGRTSSPAAQAA